MLLNKEYKYFDCKEYVSNGDPIVDALSWMESQAYAVTKACMLLEENVKDILTDVFMITDFNSMEPMLNSYARTHIEECSLIFNIKKDYKSTFDPSNAMALITANSGSTNKTILVGDADQFVIAEFMLEIIMKQSPEIRNIILKKSYFGDDGITFNKYFKHLIDKYGYSSVKDLMAVSHCSRTVIENYRDFSDTSYSAEKASLHSIRKKKR